MSGAPLDALIDQLLQIADDYRQDDPERRLTRERAENWLSQFPAAERYDILSETVNLVEHAYGLARDSDESPQAVSTEGPLRWFDDP